MVAFMEWETPHDFYSAMDAEFHFDRDVCALPENAKHTLHFTPKEDALCHNWEGVCWMNPPYDKNIGYWMQKAWDSAQKGATVVCLIQGRSSDTKWWHDYVMRSSEIRYIKNRLSFGKHGEFSRANISNVLVVFRPYCVGPPITASIDVRGHYNVPPNNH